MARLRIYLNGAETQVIELDPNRSYMVGRASDCDIRLDSHKGISRQHFRLNYENGQWGLQAVSKFGEVIFNGETVLSCEFSNGSNFRVSPYDFAFEDENALMVPAEIEVSAKNSLNHSLPPRSALTPFTGQRSIKPSDDSFDGNDDATMIVRFSGIPYIRISNTKSKSEETLRLEGNLWIAGREESCEIFLNDTKASRRQFELASTEEGYFVTDLGSSNGTLLNGAALVANTATPIKSGDIITAGHTKVQFEVRDPNFKNKLEVIAPDLQLLPTLMPLPGADIYPYSGDFAQGGALPLDQTGRPETSFGRINVHFKKAGFDLEKPKTKFILAMIVCLVVGAIFMNSEDDQSHKATGIAIDPKTIAFQKLTDPQKKMVKDTYSLAKNLFIQQKWQLAKDQLIKIHQLIPEGFEESHKILEDLGEIERNQQAVAEIEKEKRRIVENQRKLEANLAQCEPIANRTNDVNDIQNCLNEAITLDPENPRIQEMIGRVQRRVDAKDMANARKREIASLISKRRSLYEKASNLDSKGEKLLAIADYQAFLKSTLPDPDRLKAKVADRLNALLSEVSTASGQHIAEAEKLIEGNKLKEADLELKAARKVDPNNPRIAELTEKVIKELNNQLQAIYSDSVIEEGLGNIDAAKEKWRKIIELDRVGGEYYIRGKSKLRQYGN